MRAPQYCCSWVMALALWHVGASGYTMMERCKFWSGTGYIGDPSNCRIWGYCQNNTLVERQSCLDGLLYNFRDGTCKKAEHAMCYPDLQEICASLQPEEYAADPADCRRFAKCDAIEDPTWMSCGEDEVFSNAKQTCIQEVSGCPQDNICSLMKDNSVMGDPSTCRNYFKCMNGFATKKNCSAGRYFNRETGHCQSWLPEHCSEDEEIEPPTPAPTSSQICRYYQVDRSGEQRIPDMLTCYGYYTCTSQFDLGKWNSCPGGSHFQWWSGGCGSPEENSCSYDRCANLHKSLVTTINTGCREYTVCHNQRSTKSEKCPDDYPYFDELAGQCTRKFQNYRVCFMDG